MAIACGLGLPLAFLVGLRLLGCDLAADSAAPGNANRWIGFSGMLPLVSRLSRLFPAPHALRHIQCPPCSLAFAEFPV
jgi:hypothetical protein